MMDPRYIKFSAYWDDILATGLVPFAALLFFNSMIYLKISRSKQHEYRFVGVRRPSTAVATTAMDTTVVGNTSLIQRVSSKQ